MFPLHVTGKYRDQTEPALQSLLIAFLTHKRTLQSRAAEPNVASSSQNYLPATAEGIFQVRARSEEGDV